MICETCGSDLVPRSIMGFLTWYVCSNRICLRSMINHLPKGIPSVRAEILSDLGSRPVLVPFSKDLMIKIHERLDVVAIITINEKMRVAVVQTETRTRRGESSE